MHQTATVVVTYNRKKLLAECLEALLSQSAPCDLLIVDNASTDGTREYLEELRARCGEAATAANMAGSAAEAKTVATSEVAEISPEIHIFHMEENLGGAGGFSFGIKKGVSLGYRYLWVMDDDCIPEKDALWALLRSAERHGDGFGFLASKVLYEDGETCEINMPKQGIYHKRSHPDQPEYPCDFACFTSVLFPAEVVRAVGLPIREFFIWSDDWEYTRRISRQLPCYGVMDSVAVHKPASRKSCDIVSETGERLNRYPYIYRNDVFLYRREGLPGALYVLLRAVLHTVRVLLRSPGQRLQKCGIIWGSTIKGFGFRPGIEGC